jgi:hypothetical protein
MKVTKKAALRLAVAALLPLGLLSPAGAADATDVVLYAPADLKGVPALPFTGETIKFTDPISGVGPLVISNMQGPTGTPLTISATGLKANTEISLTWSTAKGYWKGQLLPNSVNYTGYGWDKFSVILAKVTTDATGSFKYSTKMPEDFGGPHDIYAVLDGVAVAKGGVQMTPSVSITPKSGPVGSPVTITYKGMGPNLYTAGISVLWDSNFAGEAQSIWTRGTSTFNIYASGSVGKHVVCAMDGIGVQYMNINQSPVPYAGGDCVTYTVTKDNGPKPAFVTYPQSVTPTTTQRTLMNEQLDPASKAVMKVSKTEGIVGEKIAVNVSGLTAKTEYAITWANVVGSRVNCTTGTCWVYSGEKIATVTSDDNGAVATEIAIPDHLGGFHALQIKKGDLAQAQQSIYVKQSIFINKDKKGVAVAGIAKAFNSKAPEPRNVSGTPTLKFKAGEEITVAMKGVGWTQLDNTMAVTYDNNYVGYGCGFNSDGYMVIHLRATGAPGTHIIDLHPLMYTNQPSFANTQFGMLPVLSYNTDFFGLALGYKQPAVHFEIEIVK